MKGRNWKLAATIALLAGLSVMLVRAAEGQEPSGWPDVPDGHRWAADVDYGTERGWFIGYPDGDFKPDQPITDREILDVVRRMFPDGLTRAQFAGFVRRGEPGAAGLAGLPPLAAEYDRGYDRDSLFPSGWIKSVNERLGWGLKGCRWAYYSRSLTPDCGAAGLSRDHLLPVAEFWRSGGYKVERPARTQFYYDVTNLWVLPEAENDAKSDHDPAEWLPPRNVCRYLGDWLRVKNKYALSADGAELDAIVRRLLTCPDEEEDGSG